MTAQNPVLDSVRCAINNGKYTVTITWTPIQGSTYFYAGVFNPQNQSVAHSVVDSSRGSYVANIQNITLDPSTAYTVMVAQCDVNGTITSAYSAPWNLLQNPLTNLTVYNNLTSLSISATLPTVGIATGIDATLVDTKYDPMANGVITGSSGSLPVDVPLDPSKTYTLYVNPAANGGTNQGPSSSLPLLMTSVRVGRVKYDGNNMTVFPGTALTANNFAGWLTAGDETITSNTGSASSVSLTKDWTQLDLSCKYTVLLRVVNGTSYGPSSNATPVMVAPPDLASASYVGGKVGVTWDVPPIQPKPTGGTVAALANGNVAGTTTDVLGYKGSIDISSVKPASSLSVQVNSKYGVAYGPPASVNIPFTAPTISSVSAADGCVNVAWSAVTDAPGYRVYLNDSSGKPITFLDTTDTSAALSASLNAASGYKVSMQVHGTSNGILLSGPVSAEVDAIAAVPVITEAIYDGTKVSVTWEAVTNTAGITGYSATLLDPETLKPTGNPATVTGATATTVNITATLETYLRYFVAVQATGASSSGALGKAVELISTPPIVTAVDISVASVSIFWTNSPCPSVSGYVVKISDNAYTPTDKTIVTEVSSVTFANDLTPAQVHVTVTARSNLATGPRSRQVNLFGTDESFYPLPVSNTDNTPYLIRSATNQPAAVDITFAFPDVFTSAPATLPDAGTFKLETNSASTVYPYKLTVASDSDAWNFDATSRSTLATDFLNFIKKMEMPEGTNVLIKGGALAMVRQSIALGLPLLYSEIPRYMYAFNPDDQTGGYVDLVPGMRLRVDSEVYQSTPPANNQAGYITNGSATYEIHSYVDGQSSDLKTGFDAFLSAMQRTTVPSPLDSVNSGGAGVIDLYTSGGRLPYYRLLYPGSLHDPKYTGLVNQTDLPVILGATNYNTLITATEQYINNGNFSGLTGIFPFFFRGRSIPVPEIAVTLNGEKRWVPVGSTVANLLETEGSLPQLVNATVSGFIMERSIGGLTDNTSAAGNVAAKAVTTNRVRLEYAVSTFTPAQPGFFGLPLLAGDLITLGVGGG